MLAFQQEQAALEKEGLIHYCGRRQAPCFLACTHLDKPLLLSMNWT